MGCRDVDEQNDSRTANKIYPLLAYVDAERSSEV